MAWVYTGDEGRGRNTEVVLVRNWYAELEERVGGR